MRKAKRGDLITISQLTTAHCIGRPAEQSETIHLAVVTSVTREGAVKAAEGPSLGTWTRARRPYDAVAIVPASVPADEAMELYSSRRYPTAPDSSMVYPWHSLAEVVADLRPLVRV
jgi:hypothetical protein